MIWLHSELVQFGRVAENVCSPCRAEPEVLKLLLCHFIAAEVKLFGQKSRIFLAVDFELLDVLGLQLLRGEVFELEEEGGWLGSIFDSLHVGISPVLDDPRCEGATIVTVNLPGQVVALITRSTLCNRQVVKPQSCQQTHSHQECHSPQHLYIVKGKRIPQFMSLATENDFIGMMTNIQGRLQSFLLI